MHIYFSLYRLLLYLPRFPIPKLTSPPVDQTQSSTYDVVEEGQFNISYVDGTGSSGNYFQDTFSIGGSTIKSFEMGLGLQTTIGVGIMGIGYNVSEANVGSGNGTIYPNLPYALADAGLINANAYSLWLNDLRAYIYYYFYIFMYSYI